MVKIHPLSDVQSTQIGEGTTIWQFCVVLKDARIDSNCNLNAQVFVENHVSIGNNVTIKPGVQVWDGITLEDDVFVGSDTQLVAPVTIGQGATIAAGTTVTNNVGAGELVISRVKQRQIAGWTRPLKNK